MQYKKLLKLGVITAGITLTTALLIGCSNVPIADTTQTIHVSPSSYVEEPIISQSDTTLESTTEVDTDIQTPTDEVDTNDNLANLTQVTVKRVVDGDTYVVSLNGEDTKIRLIGVDTPESVAPDSYLEQSGKENTKEGKDISDIMKDKLPEGTTLYLEFDVNMYDKYDRVLAYAYFEDGEMVQEYLLNNGYAKVMTIEPNVAYSDRFVALEQAAMDNGVGIWEGYEDLFEER